MTVNVVAFGSSIRGGAMPVTIQGKLGRQCSTPSSTFIHCTNAQHSFKTTTGFLCNTQKSYSPLALHAQSKHRCRASRRQTIQILASGEKRERSPKAHLRDGPLATDEDGADVAHLDDFLFEDLRGPVRNHATPIPKDLRFPRGKGTAVVDLDLDDDLQPGFSRHSSRQEGRRAGRVQGAQQEGEAPAADDEELFEDLRAGFSGPTSHRTRTGEGSPGPSAASQESEAYAKRAEESKAAGIDAFKRPPRGGDPPPPGKWEWTLNWDPIEFEERRSGEEAGVLLTDRLFCGSCPRSASDVDRLVDEAGVDAILSLQSDVCLEAMQVDFAAVAARAEERGVLVVRVPVMDFDRLDQAAMLPELVRRLASLMALGRRTYVHCTAGINRASLTILGYLTFVQGMQLSAALELVQGMRPQAHPYVECWHVAQRRLLAERAEHVYLATQQHGSSVSEGGDWIKRDMEAAERAVIQAHYGRCVASDLFAMQAAANLARAGHTPLVPPLPEKETAAQKLESLDPNEEQ